MNTMTLTKRLWRLLSSLFHTKTPPADTPASVDPYEQYKDRIPNRASRRALKQSKEGTGKEFESMEEFRKHLDSL